MRHGLITALLAAVFYGTLLFWSVSWQRASASKHELVDATGDKAPPAAAPIVANPPISAAPDPEVALPPPPPEPTPSEPARFAAEQGEDGTWEIGGMLPSQTTLDALRTALAADGASIDGAVEISADSQPAPWGEPLASWLPVHTESTAGNAGIAVIDGELLLAGDVYSQEEARALTAAASAHFASSGLTLVEQFEVVPAPEAPELAIAPDGNGGLKVAGRLRELELKNRLLELINEVGDGMPVEEQLSVGDHVAAASWGPPLVQVIPGLLTEVKGLQLMASGGVFLMAGSVSADSTKSALAEMADQAFEGVPISIENQLTVIAPPEPASLTISRGEDGALRLEGVLPDADLSQRIAAAAVAADPQAPNPINEITTKQNVAPAPWIGTMEELVAPFAAATRWGALSVHGDQVAIEAKVTDPESADVLAALISNGFPEPGYKCVIEISVAEPEGPSEEDILALEQAAKETVIYFDSSSSDLRPGAGEKLATLAASLTAVPGSGIALLGHTDPYGNADFNRKLSRQRCEAVQAALEELGIEQLLIEIEERGEVADAGGKTYESGRRVEFEQR